MKTERSCTAGVIVAIGLSAIFPGPATAGVTNISQNEVNKQGGFPFQITKPGSYRLVSNLFVAGDTGAITTTSPDVSIDLNGFRIIGKTSALMTRARPPR